ncbi:hypothetical protein A2643_02530 [Candidatus Nomurabacteria bacterium RIFCSPHIGHO2_01_FULL_39_220]|uniref:Uncharacterized protein n=1 Tax=Candidatus Nomurabacteria bacterium RIFCSPLOWO2_02_FULL_40_67 TaxID=1801787 RepID=A0A1F6Y2X7_9BACT|nr:MAG: hypothetical protein UU01_C0003G0002 [Parcubacteria group bacterium GW2011_GWA2_40_37]KKS10821.1 MAG: hypothetical protein UU66_C0041G0002 [Parcubacteria group bacterium GW2011_GWB1_41_5]OGI61732.1 MAG: hypothetical protein A2W12_02770 [Candidatus Nomurabacteria bacterium RBG_16_40_11]OGI70775.1 MAG: hypothetical protein A2643_02530 [Candidatus Nomurabacteria bacterium RIFCSPHIGHO2_01_FULL_39_220]OGI73392.1 MAG: hypothetical protein A2W56_00360 [Candidatus Nomurabacteria bacterium RIFCS
MKTNIFDRLSFLSLFFVVVLLPLFFLPFANIPVETSKGLLLVAGLALCIVFWTISRLIDGKIVFPKSWLLLAGFGIVLVFFISALFAGVSQVSLFGTMLDVGSFWFIFSAFILMLMSAVIFQTGQRAKIVLLGTILSSTIVLIFQSTHLFFPEVTTLGVLASVTENLIGSWNALGLFAGFSGLLFLLVIEFFPISVAAKIILSIFIMLSILLAAAVNFPLVWILLGVSSLIIFIYKISLILQRRREEGVRPLADRLEEGGEKKHFPFVTFVVAILSLLFFMSAGFIGDFIPSRLSIANTEVSPSLKATMSVTKGVLAENPVLGLGPNRFAEAWSMYRPVVINNTQFWNVSFASGSGLLPTLAATSGGLGILAFLVFFILFLIIGAKSLFYNITQGVNFEMIVFFVLSLYLFIASFFYFTGAVIFLLSFAFTGVFIGLAAVNSGHEVSISFLNDHRKSFFSIVVLIILVIFSTAASFKYIERLVSIRYFFKSLAAPSIEDAEFAIGKALALYRNDLYLRTYAQIYLLKFNSLANQGKANLSDEDKALLQASLDQVIRGAQTAIAYDPKNYFNFQTLGSIYETLAASGIKDAYGKALEAYQTASTLNSNNPGLKLALAGVSNALGNVKEAKDYAAASLDLKPDYIEALIFLSQIAKNEGNNAVALSYATKALSIAPANSELIKYVDSLKNPPNITTPQTPAGTTKKP